MTDFKNAQFCKVCGEEGQISKGRCEECNDRDAYRVGTKVIYRKEENKND